MNGPWITADNLALLTDLYELTMAQAYWHEQMQGQAVFSLYFRKLPQRRNYMLACGLEDVLWYLEQLRFNRAALDYLAGLGLFREEFLRWLEDFRFTGHVYALPEGTPIFPEEPLLEVEAPIIQAQLVESYIMNQIHLQTVLASKASRVVHAARGRPVMDFGLRRMHGSDAAIKSARAFYIAGVEATSNVLGGQVYGLPVAGTMGHSYIQAHADEAEAFLAFSQLYPDTTLLVDTYDSLRGIERIIELKRSQGDDFRIKAVRLDSGDLAGLASRARAILDAAGMEETEIIASGGLEEYKIAHLLEYGAPIDGFGIGTHMGVSQDAPTLDLAYKLTEYQGEGRLKTSPGKLGWPGRKQVFRQQRAGHSIRDIVACHGECQEGRPLLMEVMRDGQRINPQATDLHLARQRAADEVAALPTSVQQLDIVEPAYPVEFSARLQEYRNEVLARVQP